MWDNHLHLLFTYVDATHLCHKWTRTENWKHSNLNNVMSGADTLIARFMWPIWGPSGFDRTQVGRMLTSWLCYLGITCSEIFLLTRPDNSIQGSVLQFNWILQKAVSRTKFVEYNSNYKHCRSNRFYWKWRPRGVGDFVFVSVHPSNM